MSSADDMPPPSVPAIRRAFKGLVTTLEERGVPYALIGGIAILQHTRVRMTEDIDAMLNVSQLALPGLLEALAGRGFDVDPVRNIRELREGFTWLTYEGIVIDLMRPVIPAYAHVIERAVRATVMGESARVSSAEGLIVMKFLAMRPQDEMDIRELLTAYGAKLDIEFIRREIDTVAETDDPRRAKFEGWVREALGGDAGGAEAP